jgi:hypothetical protein
MFHVEHLWKTPNFSFSYLRIAGEGFVRIHAEGPDWGMGSLKTSKFGFNSRPLSSLANAARPSTPQGLRRFMLWGISMRLEFYSACGFKATGTTETCFGKPAPTFRKPRNMGTRASGQNQYFWVGMLRLRESYAFACFHWAQQGPKIETTWTINPKLDAGPNPEVVSRLVMV